MIKRHHPLFVGEKVYSDKYGCFVIIDHFEEKGVLIRDCDDPNDGLEVPARVFADSSDLYQIVPNAYDRNGNPVCYEHHEDEVGYPYYSPIEDENLVEGEIFWETDSK